MVKPLAFTIVLLSLCGCMPDPCANAQISEAVSPDGKLRAVTFRRDCGATTKETVQVSIIPAKKPLRTKPETSLLLQVSRSLWFAGLAILISASQAAEHQVLSRPTNLSKASTSPMISHVNHLTNRWSQPLAAAMSRFDFMKQFSMFATLAAPSGGSAPSR